MEEDSKACSVAVPDKRKETPVATGVWYFVRIFAKIADQTAGTLKCLGLADITTMKQQPVMCIHHEFRRNDFDEPLFDFQNIFPGRQSGSVGYAENMGIDSHHILMKCRVQYDIGRFAANSGKCFQIFSVVWYFSMMFFQQYFRHSYNISGFGRIKIDCFYIRHQAFRTESYNRFRCVRDRVQFFRCLVDGNICCLCRENNGNQQFIR